MQNAFWKVGELATQIGVSIRTLHYYDQIGLLRPSHKTGSGHRLYASKDIERLQRIRSLRQLGFPLDEIRDCLNSDEYSPRQIIELHLARLRAQIDVQQQLCKRMEAIAEAMDRGEEVSTEQFIKIIEVMNMFDKYFTKEQMDQLKQRGETVGEERIRQVEAEWPTLIAEVRAEMGKGTDPSSPVVQALAARWRGLVNEFTGGDAGIAKSVSTMYQQEPSVGAKFGLDGEIFQYISRALAASKK